MALKFFHQTGVINHQDQTYFIRPLPPRLAKEHGSNGNPHIIFRRSENNAQPDWCGVQTRGTLLIG